MASQRPESANRYPLVLSQQQIDDFTANGYLNYGKILSDRELAALRCEYDAEIERARDDGRLDNLAAQENADPAEVRQMLEVYNIAARNIHFLRLVHAARLLDIIEDLLGPNIRLLATTLLYKPARHGSVVFWHQDNVHHQCFPARMVTGWLTLDDADHENGAMYMVPGSHLRPLYEDLGERTDGIDTSAAKLVGVPAGGIVFHHCQVLHNSVPNASDRPRRAIVMRFVPIGTYSPRLQTGEWSYFMHPILRMKT